MLPGASRARAIGARGNGEACDRAWWSRLRSCSLEADLDGVRHREVAGHPDAGVDIRAGDDRTRGGGEGHDADLLEVPELEGARERAVGLERHGDVVEGRAVG